MSCFTGKKATNELNVDDTDLSGDAGKGYYLRIKEAGMELGI